MATPILAGAVTVTALALSYRAGRARAPRTANLHATVAPRAPLKRGATYFLSGVMGGSGGGSANLAGVTVESQDYRALMRASIVAADPDAVIIDPADIVRERAKELHPPGTPESQYFNSDDTIGAMFGECVALAAKCDVVVSYLPMASMGSACELHEARAAGRLVIVITGGSKMGGNWVVRSYADHVLSDADALRVWLQRNLTTSPKLTTVSVSTSGTPSESTPPAAHIEGAITFLYSSNFALSRSFYQDDLGLAVRSDKGVVVFYRLPSASVAASGASLGIVQAGISAAEIPPCSAAAAKLDTVMLCLLTADVDAVYARALAGGRCESVQPPRDASTFGIYNALLRDPDGYLVELQRFHEPAEHRQFCGRE